MALSVCVCDSEVTFSLESIIQRAKKEPMIYSTAFQLISIRNLTFYSIPLFVWFK